MMGVRRAWWALARRWWALVLLATLAAGLGVRVPAATGSREHFPRHAPAALAHQLADYSAQPHEGPWRVQSDWSNYTSWHYTVSFECGARCWGRAAVHAHERHAATEPAHGRAPHHTVTVASAACTAPPLLPWITFCEEEETTATVWSDGAGGALLELRRTRRCPAAAALAGLCARRLRRAHADQLLRLRRALP